VYIDVETRGERIEAPALALLFAPFERAAKLGERGSLALGQFVVGKIAVAHGGRVWAEPRNEGGLRLSMQLPKRAPAPDAAIPRGAPRTARAPTPAPPHDRELSELNERVRSDALRQLLRLWWTARGEAELPHPWSIERRQLLALAPDIVQATVSLDDDGKPVFSWTSIGPRLERRLRGTLYADLASGEHHSREQYDCYLRSYTTRAPAYDYVRQRGAHPLSFERLLLPLARTREQGPSEILGIVLFEGVDR